MPRFAEFLDVALTMGRGGTTFGGRQIPVFVPEGTLQDKLFERALDCLKGLGFQVMDCRQKSYEEAIDSFPLQWPVLCDKWPSDERKVEPPEAQRRLLIACGEKCDRSFWGNLREHSLLYRGGVLPPVRHSKNRCIVVPHCACAAAIIKAEHFYSSFPLQYFGPIGVFDSIAAGDAPEDPRGQ